MSQGSVRQDAEPRVADPSPFDLGRPDAAAAALCLHGLTGTPYEVRSLGEALASRGLRAVGPALPGHNDSPQELARLPYTAWLDAAREAVETLRSRHERVFVVGLSMGGLLTLALGAEGRADAIAAVGTPLRLPAPVPQLVPLLKYLKPFLEKKVGSDIQDPAARARHPSYPVMPLASVHQLVRLQRWLSPRLSEIRVPTFVAHGVHDRTARPRDARAIHEAIAGSELLMLERSGHVVPVDYDAPVLAERITRFILRHG
ncbi:MAG: alpha/beta hydrolase [Myxococcota bacterium]